MRTLCFLFAALVLGFPAFGAETATTSTNALRFFVVSEKPISGGRFIDTPEFPKLGYISNAPNYCLTRLHKVLTNDVTTVSYLRRGDKFEVETNTVPAVSITMFPQDAKSFAQFTQQNINRQIVLLLKGQPLMAPMIVAPIETGTIELSWQKRPFPKKTVEAVQSLVKDE